MGVSFELNACDNSLVGCQRLHSAVSRANATFRGGLKLLDYPGGDLVCQRIFEDPLGVLCPSEYARCNFKFSELCYKLTDYTRLQVYFQGSCPLNTCPLS
jgi:hypothetical protein